FQRGEALKNLVTCGEGVPAEVVEEAAGLVAAADRELLATLGSMLQEFVNEGIVGERVFAVVRAVCRAARPAAPAPVPARSPAPPVESPEIELELTHPPGRA